MVSLRAVFAIVAVLACACCALTHASLLTDEIVRSATLIAMLGACVMAFSGTERWSRAAKGALAASSIHLAYAYGVTSSPWWDTDMVVTSRIVYWLWLVVRTPRIPDGPSLVLGNSFEPDLDTFGDIGLRLITLLLGLLIGCMVWFCNRSAASQ